MAWVTDRFKVQAPNRYVLGLNPTAVNQPSMQILFIEYAFRFGVRLLVLKYFLLYPNKYI